MIEEHNLPHHESAPIGVNVASIQADASTAASSRFSRSVCQIVTEKIGTNWTQPYLKGQRAKSAGTGFVIQHGDTPVVVTNDHVIRDASKIELFFPEYGSRPFAADIVADSPDGDLALLKLRDNPTLDTLTVANSDHVADGEKVITVGYPLGQSGQKQSSGVKSGFQMLNNTVYIQTDAAINGGNSGGPLLQLDSFGVIGINNCIIAGKNNVGYALPASSLQQFLSNYDHLKTDNRAVYVRKPFFGFTAEKIDSAMLGYLGSDDNNGVLLSSVAKGSLFDAMGLSEGDQLLSIGIGDECNTINAFEEVRVPWSSTPVHFSRMLNRLTLGDQVTFEFYNKKCGSKKKKRYAYDALTPDPRVVRPIYTPFDTPKCKVVAGMVLQELNLNLVQLYMRMNPLLAKYAALDTQCNEPAVVVTHVIEGSVTEQRGVVAPSMVLRAINDKSIGSFADINAVMVDQPALEFNKIDLHDNVKLYLSNKELLDDQTMLQNEYGHYFKDEATQLVTVQKAEACAPCGGDQKPQKLACADCGLHPSNSTTECSNPCHRGRKRGCGRYNARLRYELVQKKEATVVKRAAVDEFQLNELRRCLPSHLMESFQLP